MSAPNVPEGLKSIAPYLQRAAQLQEPNYYAAKLAIPKASQDTSNKAFVVELLDTLEKQRKEIGENEAISNDLVGYAYIENFALKIFSKADDEDHAGQGSQKTAKNFVAAANFLDLLKVFGEIDSEVEQKIKYSKWRAAEIVKAIRDGRQPAPPPGADKPKEASPDVNANIEGFESLNVNPSIGADSIANNSNAGYSPSNIPSVVPAGTQSVTGGISGFPTISNFPSPPLGSSSQGSNLGDFTNNTNNNNSLGNNNWGQQQPISPNMNQAQNFYDPTGSLQPQQPASTYTQPIFTPPAAPNSGYVPSNPTSPAPTNTQYGYGGNSLNNNNSFYQQPVVPNNLPPAQTPYGQAGFGSPSAPYQQPQQAPSNAQPYASVPMILDPTVNAQVQKHCKWTVSALTYDDIPTAVDNLEKALALLRPYHNKQ
ncbi:hypothetical protein BGZ46_009679 [Entomortierella lignicola]|nr:hypothetical protein BGZ46_009679 [Entomortierella lignicola]